MRWSCNIGKERNITMKVVVQPREAGPRIHLPVSIVIDKSESTGDIRDLLNRGAQSLIQSMKKELTFRGIVDLLVIHFSSESEVIMDFQPLEQISEHALDIHSSRGHTDTGKALLTALDALDRKKMEWKRSGEKYFQPLLFLLTDGYPDAGSGAPEEVVRSVEEAYRQAAHEIRTRERAEKIVFIAAGIQLKYGCQANIDMLRELSGYPERILQISDFDENANSIQQFYHLIHESTKAMYTGTPVEDVIGQVWNI